MMCFVFCFILSVSVSGLTDKPTWIIEETSNNSIHGLDRNETSESSFVITESIKGERDNDSVDKTLNFTTLTGNNGNNLDTGLPGRDSQVSLTENNEVFQLPAKWKNICTLQGTEVYKSEFTTETQLRVIKCTVSPEYSHLLNLKELNDVRNTSTDVKLSVEIQCLGYASVSISWPMKVWNLYKLFTRDCTIQDHYSDFSSANLDTIPDSIRVIEFINNVIMIPLSLFSQLLTKVDEFSKEYNCGHEETIEQLIMINQTEDFIIDVTEFPDILVASEEYMKDVRRIKHTCDFKHLMVIDESQSTSQSTYKLQVLIQHSIFDQLRIFNQSRSYIKSLKEPILHWSVHFPGLEIFDLSWNNISGLYRFEVPVHANPTTITTINLQHNNISMISIKQLNRLKLMPMMFLDLRNNPMDCTCGEDIEELLNYIHTGLHKSISSFVNYSYLADLQCATPSHLKGIKLGDLQVTDTCHIETSKEYFVVPIVILIVAVLILIITLFLVLRYRQDIQIILFTRFDIIMPCQSRADDIDKTYDAFVSYSSNEEDWIEEFFENLEKKPSGSSSYPFRFCMHHRDFIPGKTIFDNVIKSVESSRHTIILLSKHYLGSEFCLYEFQEAFRQSVMEQKRHLIIVMMEDIPETDLPRDLRRCIKTFTYIRKDDSLFTQRLLFALTIKPKSKIVRSSDEGFNSEFSSNNVQNRISKNTKIIPKLSSSFLPGNKSSTNKHNIDLNQINNNHSHKNTIQLTDIVNIASGNLQETGIANLAFVNETLNSNDLGKVNSDDHGIISKSDLVTKDSNSTSQSVLEIQQNKDESRTDEVMTDSSMTSQTSAKIQTKIDRLDSFSKIVMEAKANDVCYDRSLSCLSQDTGYGSDRGSYFDRNLQEICETP